MTFRTYCKWKTLWFEHRPTLRLKCYFLCTIQPTTIRIFDTSYAGHCDIWTPSSKKSLISPFVSLVGWYSTESLMCHRHVKTATYFMPVICCWKCSITYLHFGQEMQNILKLSCYLVEWLHFNILQFIEVTNYSFLVLINRWTNARKKKKEREKKKKKLLQPFDGTFTLP